MNTSTIQKFAGMILLGLGMAASSFAVNLGPEIDAATGVNALALLSGALLIIRGRKR
jgi:hypothetical protein